jgi:hypothetical protein
MPDALLGKYCTSSPKKGFEMGNLDIEDQID